MVKMGIEGLAVAALLISVKASQKIEDLLHKQGLVETQLLRTVTASICDEKFSFWDHYFGWSKVVKLGPIQNQTYKMFKIDL